MTYLKKGAIALVFAVIGFGAGVAYRDSAPISSVQSAQTYDLLIDEGKDTLLVAEDISFTSGERLLSSMESVLSGKQIPLSVKEYAGLGKLVTRIASASNGDDERYWQYWVNGRQLPIGADAYRVLPGDVILWKFARSAE